MSDRHAFIEQMLGAFERRGDELDSFRGRAKQRLEAASVPTRKDEEWRFFDVRPAVDVEWSRSTANDLTAFPIEEADTFVVVRDGEVDQSRVKLPEGAYVANLADLPETERSAALDVLGSAAAPYDDDVFAATNSALVDDVACVVVEADTVVETPIHVIFVAGEADSIQNTRLLVIAGRGSKFTVVEDYQGDLEGDADPVRHFTNAVTEFVVGENANVHHVRVQRESEQAVHVARVGAKVGQYAKYDSIHVALGAASSRHDIWVSHEGEDGWSRLDGLAMLDGDRESDTHTVVDNTRMRCESHQLHKCVVDGKGHAVFNGKIFVRQDAQKIDAYQLNRNLLLSTKAKVDTKPQLEIWADDVQCTHGATVGQLDADQLFYLQSRGLPEDEAKATLTYAFAAEVIDAIQVPSLAATLEHEARQRTMR